tara:strand:- start:13877 stop:14527 length:651 start_codon:yes stop_codon:yes gene_type:complete
MKRKKQKEVKIKSWYYDRYVTVVVQRNILLLMVIACLISISFAMIFVKYVTASKSLEPYVVEIEEKTGIATLISMKDNKEYTSKEVTKEYFITQFVTSFKSYNVRTHNSDRKIVRLFSSPSSDIFNKFKTQSSKYKNAGSYAEVKIKSIVYTSDNSAQIRILQNLRGPEGEKEKHELLKISFVFNPKINLIYEDRMVNPYGFQIIQYSSIEEKVNY